MKHLNRIFTFGFCLLALAGCSSDEAGADNGLDGLKSGDMVVTLEQLTSDEDDDVTRSFMSRDMQSHLWVEMDEMRVYDPNMIRYDVYKFDYKDETRQTGVFKRIWEKSNYTEEPTFALFSNQDVEGGYFERDRTTQEPFLTAKYMICSDDEGNPVPMTWESCQSGSKVYFTDWLPRWGQVTKVDGSGVLYTSMKFLTGVLRLQLANTAGKADLLKVQMLQGGTTPLNISGIFAAKLSVNGSVQPNTSLTQDSSKSWSSSTDLLVDLTGATGSIVVYVPLVTTTVPVDIVASASNDNGQTWTEFKRFKNKTVARGKVYGNANEYAF